MRAKNMKKKIISNFLLKNKGEGWREKKMCHDIFENIETEGNTTTMKKEPFHSNMITSRSRKKFQHKIQ